MGGSEARRGAFQTKAIEKDELKVVFSKRSLRFFYIEEYRSVVSRNSANFSQNLCHLAFTCSLASEASPVPPEDVEASAPARFRVRAHVGNHESRTIHVSRLKVGFKGFSSPRVGPRAHSHVRLTSHRTSKHTRATSHLAPSRLAASPRASEEEPSPLAPARAGVRSEARRTRLRLCTPMSAINVTQVQVLVRIPTPHRGDTPRSASSPSSPTTARVARSSPASPREAVRVAEGHAKPAARGHTVVREPPLTLALALLHVPPRRAG